MNVRRLATLLCLITLSTGCIINNNGQGDEPVPGNVAFVWSFAGTSTAGRCADVPEVQRVRLSIPGHTLPDDGFYPCNSGGVDGTVLQDLAPGSYSYTLEGIGYAGGVLYSGNGTFTVDGDEQVRATLLPVNHQPGSGNVILFWSFFPDPDLRLHCVDVPEVKRVRISFRGDHDHEGGIFPCNTTEVEGISLSGFLPGYYSFTAEALGASDEVLYKATGLFSVNGSRPVNVRFTPVNPPAPPPPSDGDVTFLWSFSDGRCADLPDVKSVRISIPGEVLENNGVYPCTLGGVDGIVLHDFLPGGYTFTIEAIGYSGQVLYQGSGSFKVNGNVRVNTTLTPAGSQSSYAYVSWYFPANATSTNPTCAQAGVAYVDVSIDSGAWTRLNCTEGWGNNQVTSPFLAPGSHTIELIGVGTDGQHYYYLTSTLNTQAGNPVSATYQIRAVGGMALRWELFDGTVKKTCDQAGITGMRINLQNTATGELVYGQDGDAQPCDGAPVLYNYLVPGQYRVYICGTGPGTLYTNEYESPTTLTVTAFQLKTGSDAVTVNLLRQ